MSKQNELDSLLRPYVEELGYECVEVAFEKVGPNWVLTIYVDTPEGITLDDCERVSEVLSPVLDEHDPIEPSYLLEVSSPGIDRPLKNVKDYERNIGEEIDIHLYSKVNGKKDYRGKISEVGEDSVTLETEDGPIEFEYKTISKAEPVIEF